MATATTTSRRAKSHTAAERATVERMLAAGQTTSVEAATGHLQALYANCPQDGAPAIVRRVSREGGGAIFEVMMRCTRCATDFIAKPEALFVQ